MPKGRGWRQEQENKASKKRSKGKPKLQPSWMKITDPESTKTSNRPRDCVRPELTTPDVALHTCACIGHEKSNVGAN